MTGSVPIRRRGGVRESSYKPLLQQSVIHIFLLGPKIPAGERDDPDRFWGPLSLLFSGYRGSYPGVNWLGYDVDLHLVQRVRKNGALTLLPLYAFLTWAETN